MFSQATPFGLISQFYTFHICVNKVLGKAVRVSMRSWCRQFIRNMNISFDKLEMILACYILDTRFSSNWIERFFSRGKNGSSKNAAIGKFSPISKSRKRYWWVSKSRFRVIFPSWSLNFFADVSQESRICRFFLNPFGLHKSPWNGASVSHTSPWSQPFPE